MGFTRDYEYREHKCDFCLVWGQYPMVFKAGPYWTHEPCLIKAVEEGRRSNGN